MILDIGDGKIGQKSDDGSIALFQDSTVIYLNPDEGQKFKRWLNKVI